MKDCRLSFGHPKIYALFLRCTCPHSESGNSEVFNFCIMLPLKKEKKILTNNIAIKEDNNSCQFTNNGSILSKNSGKEVFD